MKFKKISEISNYRRGSFPQPYTDQSYYGGDESMPFVQVADVNENMKLVDKTKNAISKKAQSKSVFAPKGSLIVTLQGSIGKVAITQYDAYIDRTLILFTELNNSVDKNFFAYALKNKFNNEKEYARGITIKTITKEEMEEFLIPIPTLKKQKEIVNYINLLTNLINQEKNKKILFDELIKSRFNEMFASKIFKKPCKFCDICESLIGLTYKPSNVSSEGTIVLRSGNIQNNELQLDHDVVRVENIKIPENKIIKANDILMCSRNGSARLVGKSCLIKETTEVMSFGAFMTVIRTKYPYIVESFLNSEYFRCQLTCTGTSSVNQITNQMLNSYDIFKPTDEEEKTFASFVKLIDKSKLIVQKQIDLLQELLDKKMQEYFGD